MRAITFLLILISAGLLAIAAVFYFVPDFRGDIAVAPGFSVGAVHVRYYGLILAVSILLALYAAMRLSARAGINARHVEELLPWVVVFGFVGARLYFAVFSWEHFADRPLEILQAWKGGFSIYGGFIGGALGIWLFARRKGQSALKFLDLAAAVAPLAQTLGRFGNFFNQEAYGAPTSLPWKMYIEPGARPPEHLGERFFHPAFLYESLWDFAVFLIMLMLWWRQSPRPSPGFFLGIYLILYSMGRFFIEGVRLDSFFAGHVRVDQIAALIIIVVGLLLIIYKSREKASA